MREWLAAQNTDEKTGPVTNLTWHLATSPIRISGDKADPATVPRTGGPAADKPRADNRSRARTRASTKIPAMNRTQTRRARRPTASRLSIRRAPEVLPLA